MKKRIGISVVGLLIAVVGVSNLFPAVVAASHPDDLQSVLDHITQLISQDLTVDQTTATEVTNIAANLGAGRAGGASAHGGKWNVTKLSDLDQIFFSEEKVDVIVTVCVTAGADVDVRKNGDGAGNQVNGVIEGPSDCETFKLKDVTSIYVHGRGASSGTYSWTEQEKG